MRVNIKSGGISACLHSLPAVVLLLLDSTVAVHAVNCTQEENTRMQTQFTECSGKVTAAYQKSMEAGDPEGATCNLFTNLLSDCAKLWQLCHSEDDIRKMKDMQLEALLGQYVDSGIVTLEDCPVVNEYWSAEGTEEEETGSNSCSDRLYIQTQTKFQTCSHEISSAVYNSFQEITEPKEIEKEICESLKNISSTCTPLLEACFVEQDIRQIVRMHLQEIAGYLISLSTIRINISAVEECEAHDEFEYEQTVIDTASEDAVIVAEEPVQIQEEAQPVQQHEAKHDIVHEELSEEDIGEHKDIEDEPGHEDAHEHEDLHEHEPEILMDISEQFVTDIPFENIATMEASRVNKGVQRCLLSHLIVLMLAVLTTIR